MKKTLIMIGALICGTSVYAMSPAMYSRVMTSVQTRNLKMLQNLVAGGVELNSPIQNGMTPLCETVATGDYEGYEMLQTQGASPYVSCMRRLPQDQVSEFYANQPPAHTYYTGRMAAAKSVNAWGTPVVNEYAFPYLGVGEFLLGGVAAGAIVALGKGAASSGGGGGEGDKKWAAPLNLDPKTFETAQYKSSKVPIYSSTSPKQDVAGVNFLGAIKASSAYARGYTGYKVLRKSNGELEGSGKEAISTNSVSVAVVDSGVWSNHTKLEQNIAISSNKTYNFVYGPCATAQTTGSCWKWDPLDEIEAAKGVEARGKISLYVDGTKTNTMQQEVLRGAWFVYSTRYKNVAYDKNNVKPTLYYQWNGMGVDSGLQPYNYYVDESGDRYVYMESTVGDTKTGASYLVTCDSETCTYTKNDVEYIVTLSTNYDNHGTMVAGLVGARSSIETEGMMGVAYNANIIPIEGDAMTQNVLNHVKDAVELGADIVNLSYGTTEPMLNSAAKDLVAMYNSIMNSRADYYDAYRAAAKNNTILVFAAGNYGRTGDDKPYDSSLFSMAPLSNLFNGTTKASDGNTYNLNGLFVNVVALNSSNKLASYSAKCGITKEYCVAAPGGDVDGLIYSTANVEGSVTDTYSGSGGTSMAAPIVSGALAVIKGAFPHLTNQQVVQILFETATDLGDKGVDEIYGHGLINLDAATSPIGLPKISLTNSTTGVKIGAGESSSSVTPAFAKIAHALPSQMIVLDKYDRAFAVPTTAFVHVAKRENKFDGHFKSFMSGDEKVAAQTDTVRMAYSERHSKLSSQMNQGSVRFELKPSVKWQFKTFYSENTETSGGTYFERLMASPYGKMKEAWGGAIGYNVSKNWRVGMQGQVGQNGFVNEKDLSHMNHNRMSLFQSSVQYTGLKKVGLKAVAGVANEQGSLFGMWGRGAFKTGNSKTTYVGAGVTLNLTDAVQLEGMYYSGSTKVSQANSLMKMSGVKSESFALTAAWQVNEDRTMGLHLSSPLRVKHGTARVTLPVARDAYQNIVYQNTTEANLKPSAREYDLGFYYTDALREDVRLKSEFGVRLNPDHVSGAAPDWRALVGLHWGL